MKKKKILYVFGYGDNPIGEKFISIKKQLNTKKFDIISDYYAQYSPKEAKYDLENIIKDNNIDIIIGEELGGYLISLLDNCTIKKISIDPLTDPIKELKEYTTKTIDEDRKEVEIPLVPDHIIKFYTDDKCEENFNNIKCIYSDISKTNQYKEQYKDIKYSEDILNSIVEEIESYIS